MSDIIDSLEPIKDYYFTFGFSQKHENHYTIISARSRAEAREIMVSHYGLEWAFQYSSAEDTGVKEFNIKYLHTKVF